MASKRYARVGGDCVACGSCIKVCPRGAVFIYKGVAARIRQDRCVGCGRCAAECPASTISMAEREAVV